MNDVDDDVCMTGLYAVGTCVPVGLGSWEVGIR